MLHLRNRRRAIIFCSLFYSVTLTYAKPTNLADEVVPIPSPSPSSADVVSYALPGAQTGGRRIIHSRTDDGMWQASARLPSSSQAGGNEHSRYKIRRDGSLSLTLEGTQPYEEQDHHHTPTTNNHDPHANYLSHKPTHDNHFNLFESTKYGDSVDPQRQNRRGKEAPVELRSFSVVLSDVDVTGRYGEDNEHEDSYSEAGVSGYHLHSNSIHRMNASWKLNSRNSSPTSEDLLQFLAMFSNDNKDDGSENDKIKKPSNIYHNTHLPHQKLMGIPLIPPTTPITTMGKQADHKASSHPESHHSDGGGDKAGEKEIEEQMEEKLDHHLQHQMQVQMKDPMSFSDNDEDNLPPFSTWSESSRNIFGGSNDSSAHKISQFADVRVGRSNNDETANNSSNGTASSDVTSRVLLHDLLTTLEKFSEKSGSDEISSKKENDTQIFEKSAGNGTENETKETLARMKISDPQQTAADLKKLMGLLLSSNGGATKDPTNGAEVVNIVITPNTNSKTNSNGEQEDLQRILFLKSPQVKQLLDAALSDPAVSSAAQKIAAALHVPHYDDHNNHNVDINQILHPSAYNNYPSFNKNKYEFSLDNNNNSSEDAEQTPDGFPLTGAGFLNLHHPNLQFHQALHHLVANGSAPTSINASTKTNVINIFVLNFNGNNGNKNQQLNHQNQQGKLKIPLPFAMKPLLMETVNPDIGISDGLAHNQSPALSPFIANKIGVAAATESTKLKWPFPSPIHSPQESLYDVLKPTTTTTTLSPLPPHLLSPPTITNANNDANKVNILDLLPGDISAHTPVEFDKAPLTQQPQSHYDFASSFISDPSRGATTKRPINSVSTPPNIFHHISSPNIKDKDDILSYLAAVNKKYASTTENPLPPELSHLGWIFKNQPPPKPNVPYKIKSKNPNPNGQKNNGDIIGQQYDDGDDKETETDLDSADPDSMMETDETSHYEQLLQHLSPESIKYDRILFINDNSQNETVGENSNSTFQVSIPESLNSLDSSTVKNDERDNSTSTTTESTAITKKPAFTKFGIKVPIGGYPDDGTDLNSRVRKLLTALGFSAIPTLAAGAAATWPYWVPLVATGRKRRDLQGKELRIPDEHLSADSFIEIAQKANEELNASSVSGRMVKMETSTNTKERGSTRSTTPISVLATAVNDSSATKGKEEGQEAKWIKVEVITESSPTFPSVKNKSSSAHPSDATNSSTSDNNRHFGNGEPQDVPLLKNFLKNVLSSEWSISTTTPSSTNPLANTFFPMHQQHNQMHPQQPPLRFPLRPMQYSSNSFPSTSTASTIVDYQQQPQQHINAHNENGDNDKKYIPSYNYKQSLFNKNKVEMFKPPGQDVSIIVGAKKVKRPNNSLIDQMSKKKLAAALQEAEESYSSAALFPIWFPILFGNTKVPVSKAKIHRTKEIPPTTTENRKTDLTFGRTVDLSALDKPQRTNRLMSSSWNRNRDDLMQNGDGEGENENSENDEDGLLQSVSAISSQILEKNEDSLENSSEKDVYLNDDSKNKNGNNQKVKNNAEEQDEEENNQSETEEVISDEESDKQSGSSTSVTSNPKRITPVMSLDLSSPQAWVGDDIENEDIDADDNSVVAKLKSDAYSSTTPKGLTTWSAVNGGISTSSSTYFKGSVQKLPSDHSVSGMLSFSTERPMTTVDMINSKDYMTTDQPPRTTKAKPLSNKPNRKRPHPHIKKVSPTKFVRPSLENVAAHQISSDDNYNTFQLRPIAPENKASPGQVNKYTMQNTRRPLWPGQVQVPTTRRPVNRNPAFQKITSRPKNPVLKSQTQTRAPILTLTTPTTTTPPTTTVYYRNPTNSLISPFPMVSLSNMPFMDFVRSQIIPRLGLSLLSFMTTTPLILSLLGAAAGAGRKKRDLSQYSDEESEQKMIPVEDLDSLNAKWEQIDKAEQRKHKNIFKRPNPITPDRYEERDSHKQESMFTQLLRKLFRSSEQSQKENSSKTS